MLYDIYMIVHAIVSVDLGLLWGLKLCINSPAVVGPSLKNTKHKSIK